MEYNIDGIKIYSRIHWFPTTKNLLKSVWLLVQVLISIEAIWYTHHMIAVVLVIGLLALFWSYKLNEIN